jgi:hypothetical protein
MRSDGLTGTDWAVITEYMDILKPLKTAIKRLKGRSKRTLDREHHGLERTRYLVRWGNTTLVRLGRARYGPEVKVRKMELRGKEPDRLRPCSAQPHLSYMV